MIQNSGSNDFTGNSILDQLGMDFFYNNLAHFRLENLAEGQMLIDTTQSPGMLYFLISGLLSVVFPLLDGSAVEVATKGRNLFWGIGAFLGGSIDRRQAIVIVPGLAWTIKGETFRDLIGQSPERLAVVLRALGAHSMHLAQTAACNARHHNDQRIVRWLLTATGLAGRSDLRLTQEKLSQLMGIRRAGVTACLAELKRRGLVEIHRTHITILDRAGLEGAGCECHRVLLDGLAPKAGAKAGATAGELAIGTLPA